MSLFTESVGRLQDGPNYDVVLYLDERGTPATDRRFVTGGVLVYAPPQDIASSWDHLWVQQGLAGKKGRDLTRNQLLTLAAFLIGNSILPVAVWSMLDEKELGRLRAFSKTHERSKSRLKKFRKMSGASWLWKHQMSQAVAYAEASFLAFIGPIGTARVHIDEMYGGAAQA